MPTWCWEWRSVNSAVNHRRLQGIYDLCKKPSSLFGIVPQTIDRIQTNLKFSISIKHYARWPMVSRFSTTTHRGVQCPTMHLFPVASIPPSRANGSTISVIRLGPVSETRRDQRSKSTVDRERQSLVYSLVSNRMTGASIEARMQFIKSNRATLPDEHRLIRTSITRQL